jgi:hypothetical protein
MTDKFHPYENAVCIAKNACKVTDAEFAALLAAGTIASVEGIDDETGEAFHVVNANSLDAWITERKAEKPRLPPQWVGEFSASNYVPNASGYQLQRAVAAGLIPSQKLISPEADGVVQIDVAAARQFFEANPMWGSI